jgi:hypothetical protein
MPSPYILFNSIPFSVVNPVSKVIYLPFIINTTPLKHIFNSSPISSLSLIKCGIINNSLTLL